MVLVCDNILSCDLQIILSNQTVEARTHLFLDKMQMNTDTPNDRPCLCMMQGESATVNTSSMQLLVGSQDATTCVVAVLACPQTRVVWVSHLDYPHLGEKDVAGIESALTQMQQPQLYLVGGYCDHAGRGPELAQSFLQLMHSMDASIQLQLCCVGAANTTPSGAPRCCQLVLDTASWQPQPWVFTDRGPEVVRRFVAQHCRSSSRCRLLPVWDQQQQQLVLRPFDATIDSWQVMSYERLLRLSDQELLQYMSTSPDHEPQWFVQDMRNMLVWLLSAQEPHTPERLAANSTRRYVCNGCSWQLVRDDSPVVTTAAVRVAAAEKEEEENEAEAEADALAPAVT